MDKTDLQKLEELLIDIGCQYELVETIKEYGVKQKEVPIYKSEHQYDTSISLNEGVGYIGFYCSFYFLNGKFQCHGVLE